MVPIFGRFLRFAFAALILLLGLPAAVHAQLSACKGASPTGSLECTAMPQVISPWSYSIPGPIRGTGPAPSLSNTIATYKGFVAANAGTSLCSGPTETVGSATANLSSWNFKQLPLRYTIPISISFGVRIEVGPTNAQQYECSLRVINTTIYQDRTASCDYGKGWNQMSDSSTLFCALPMFASCEDNSCPVGNPALPGSGVKIQSETDYSGSGAHPLAFSRVYRSRWALGAHFGALGFVPSTAGGAGWMHNFERQVREVPYAPVRTMRVMRPDGSVNAYSAGTPDAQGVVPWSPAMGVRDTLTEQRNASKQLTGWLLKLHADDSTEQYDASGKLLRITERNGWITQLTYSTAATSKTIAPGPGHLIRVTNHFGRALNFTYNATGRMLSMVDPATGVIRYGYDGLGNLSGVTWPDIHTRRYHYEDTRYSSALTGITDELGVRIGTYAYDSSGHVTSTERAAGTDRLTFGYSSPGNWGYVRDSKDPNRSYQFSNTAGVLRSTGVSSPLTNGGPTEKSAVFDANGDKVKTVAFDGSVTFTSYDSQGRPTERATFPASFASATTRPALSSATSVLSTQWHASWNLPLQQAEPGRVTSYAYDAKGNLTGQSASATTDTTGSAKFAVVKTGPTVATTWGYDAKSLNTTVVETVGGVTQRSRTSTYDALGNLKSLSNTEAGVTSTATVGTDAHGRITSLSASNGAQAQWVWSARGLLSSATLPGYSVVMTLDARGLPLQYLFSNGAKVVVTYDANGEPVTVTNGTNAPQQVVMGSVREQSGAPPITALASVSRPWRLAELERWVRQAAGRLPPLSLPLPAARAQPLPPPPMPPWLIEALGVGGAATATSKALDADGPAACCGAPTFSAPDNPLASLPPQFVVTMLMMQATANVAAQAINDEILILRSTRKLRKNMCADNRPKPLTGCWAAHHIVAVKAELADPARKILDKYEIGIDNAINGMWLECVRHGTLHSTLYYTRVNAELTAIDKFAGNKLAIEAALLSIRVRIAAGTFP